MVPDPANGAETPAAQPSEAEVAQPPQPTIHEAELEPGPLGRVLRGAEIDLPTAAARRGKGQNVVVCGEDQDANRRLANQIESTVGPSERGDPHIRHAGKYALPHYQQTKRTPPGPGGHTFYETARRKARKKP